VTGYLPSNEVEQRLVDAVAGNDPVGFLRVLARAPLYLAGDAARARLTLHLAGRVYLVACTSVPALESYVDSHPAEGAAPDTYWVSTVDELADRWPDPAWRLAVNPHLPIGAYLSVDELRSAAVPTLADLVTTRYTGFVPANEAEERMGAALATDDPAGYYAALVRVPLLLPRTPPPGCPPDTVAVFTSPQRLAEAMDAGVDTVTVGLADLVAGWPGPSARLVVDPGSALAVTLTGTDLLAVLSGEPVG
jgi:hypothetical protein